MTIAVIFSALTPLVFASTTEYVGMVPIHAALDYQYMIGQDMVNDMLASGAYDAGTVALANDFMNPNIDIAENQTFQMQWMKLQYPAGATTVDAVSVTLSPNDTETRDALGQWSNLIIERGVALTSRIDGDSMILLMPKGAGITYGEAAITDGDHIRSGSKLTQQLRRLQRLQRRQRRQPAAAALTAQSADDEATRSAREGVPGKGSLRVDECVAGSDDDGFFVPMEQRHCTTLTMINKDASKPTRTLSDWKGLLKGVFPGYFEAHHTLTISMLPGGQRVALVQVAYHDPSFSNYTLVDGVVAVDLETFQLVPTADGELAYKVHRSIAFYGDPSKNAYRIQYQGCDFNEVGARNCEANIHNGGTFSNFTQMNSALHANGLERFQAGGSFYLVMTFQRSFEAVVITCPWTYTTKGQGGNAIVQRFGTPSYWNESHYNGALPFSIASRRSFGMPLGSHDFTEGMHNVFFTPASTTSALRGKPTLTIFVNYDAMYPTPASSFVYELEFRPVPEGSARDTGDDTVFDTPYVNLRMPFHGDMNGGARPIGDGVYVVAAGTADDATICLADLRNGTACFDVFPPPDKPLYDPFLRVLV